MPCSWVVAVEDEGHEVLDGWYCWYSIIPRIFKGPLQNPYLMEPSGVSVEAKTRSGLAAVACKAKSARDPSGRNLKRYAIRRDQTTSSSACQNLHKRTYKLRRHQE